MNLENNSARRSIITAKILAVLIFIMGIYIIFATILSVFNVFYKKENISNWVIIFLALAVCLGGYCVCIGSRAWFKISATIVRRICAIIALFICSALFAVLFRNETDFSNFQELAWMMLKMLLIVIAGGVFYTLSGKVLIRWFALEDTIEPYRQAILKQYFGYVVSILWAAVSFWIISILPSEELSAVLVFVLLLFGFILYKLICKYFIKPA
jgi:MFS family permease